MLSTAPARAALAATAAAVLLALAGWGGGQDGHADNPPAQPYSKRSTAAGAVARVTPADYRRPVATDKRYVRGSSARCWARSPHAIFAAFDAIAPWRAELPTALQALSERARRLTRGYDALLGAPGEGPTPDSGILGPRVTPDGLTVTIAFGASLFGSRYGLAALKPRALKPMTTFPDDALVPEECHGDVLVQLCANSEQTLLNALRDLMRATRGSLAPRWKIEGFLPVSTEPGVASASRWTRTSAWRGRAPRRPRARASCAAATATRAAWTSPASSTWVSSSAASRPMSRSSSRSCSGGLPASRWSTTSCRPAAATSFAPSGARDGQDWVGSGLFV